MKRRVVWKHTLLPFMSGNEIEMPKGAEILSLHCQDDKPTIWSLCDPTAPLVKRRFWVVTTGLDFTVPERNFKYLGTCLLDGGRYVIHVFDGGEV